MQHTLKSKLERMVERYADKSYSLPRCRTIAVHLGKVFGLFLLVESHRLRPVLLEEDFHDSEMHMRGLLHITIISVVTKTLIGGQRSLFGSTLLGYLKVGVYGQEGVIGPDEGRAHDVRRACVCRTERGVV